MSIKIKTIKNKKDLKAFIHLPWKIYQNFHPMPSWVPPLLIEEKQLFSPKNPFYTHISLQSFLAERNGKILGRISAIIDTQYIQHKEPNTGYFGFFESINDLEIAKALLNETQKWLADRGMHRMIGPISPTPNHILGIQLNNFETPPVVQTPCSQPFYQDLMKQAGLSKEEDHYAYIHSTKLRLDPKVERISKAASKRYNITFKEINMKKFDDDVETIRQLWNDAWSNNKDFVPWKKKVFKKMAEGLKFIAIPKLILIAYIKGEPAGFLVPLPDVNEILIKLNGRLFPFGILKLLWGKNKVSTLRVSVMGIRRKFQGLGVDSVFIKEVYQRGEGHGFTKGELSLIIEDNKNLLRFIDKWGAERYKTYRVYQKKFN